MNVEAPVTPIIHALPKIHKGLDPPPLRPIVSGIGSLTERLGEWLDAILQPLVRRTPGFIKDTGDVLRNFYCKKWHSKYTWLTADVVALYPSIPHAVALVALEFHLHKYSPYSMNFIEYVLEVTQYLLTHNYFLFDDTFFLQIRGVSMGAKFSPSLANLVMAYWEERYIYTVDNPFGGSLEWYGRYIDDLLIIWGGDVPAIPSFMDYLNDNPYNLRFTAEHHQFTINFLDLTLTGVHDEVIGTATFRKTTFGNSILRANSHHPLYTIKSIPVGELIRARRNCNSEASFAKECEIVTARFLNRGYPLWMLSRAEKIARSKNRKDLLFKHNQGLSSRGAHSSETDVENVDRNTDTSESHRSNLPTLVITYSNQFSKIKQAVADSIAILYEDPVLYNLLKTGYRVIPRRSPTLANSLSPSMFSPALVRKKEPWLKYVGFSRCGSHPCKTCRYAKPVKMFHDSDHATSFNIKSYINCNSVGVVYVIECTKCDLLYVGNTTRKLKTRVMEHLNYIVNPTYTNISNVARHFIQEHNRSTEFFCTYGIENVRVPKRGGSVNKILLQREAFWILRLKTRVPAGLNLRRELMYVY